ncbi:64.2 kDa Inhibitor of apoptosis/RING-finger profile [Spodoptera frugiperda ascovirus 1a]|uniref:64.2 kDa Inhibitor of apoptosis/RING-finger profile n=1 Tax=Spodoptera frugiperda ascovirus 1a TaxID=113370 RepID=Q0E586_SFAVA|nr:64.2 kDa Inhibitor of apoptosis/RING-finger profile [Spodoptera frugiperda ascovirus 1a]CAL44615.1 64.2 kDa Inhibitor of apoptosis/RING-finger profile [Spodoptera frugiperda ascovirus 1a]
MGETNETFTLTYSKQDAETGLRTEASVRVRCGHRWTYNSVTEGGNFAVSRVKTDDSAMRLLFTTYDYAGVQKRRMLYWLEDDRLDMLTSDGRDVTSSAKHSFGISQDRELREATMSLVEPVEFVLHDDEMHLTIDSSNNHHVLEVYDSNGRRLMDVLVSDVGTFNGQLPTDADHYMFKFARDSIRELGQYTSTVVVEVVDNNALVSNVELVLSSRNIEIPAVIHGDMFYGPYLITRSDQGIPDMSIIVSNYSTNGDPSKVDEIKSVARSIYYESRTEHDMYRLYDGVEDIEIPESVDEILAYDSLTRPLREVVSPQRKPLKVVNCPVDACASRKDDDLSYLTRGNINKTNMFNSPERIQSRRCDNRPMPYPRSKPKASEVDNAQATITADDLVDMSKLTLTRMRAFLKKNTNIVGVTRYNRTQLEQAIPRAVREVAEKRAAAAATTAQNQSNNEEDVVPRQFNIDMNKKLADCSRTRSTAIAVLEKRYNTMVVCSDKVSKPARECIKCSEFMQNWRSVTYGTCGHSVVCVSCDEANADDVEKKCPLCEQIVMYTYVFRPKVSLLPGF